MANDTHSVLGPDARKCESRSLILDRFSDPILKKDERRAFFEMLIKKKPLPGKLSAWRTFLRSLQLSDDDLLFAQLQARLIINASTGVMENAGVCLDRFAGVPYVPGSAVKGCARRWALSCLREWTSTGEPLPGFDQLADLRPASPERFLQDIALVFGWVDTDWKADLKDSDFAWACSDRAEEMLNAAQHLLSTRLGHADFSTGDWKSRLGSFAGKVSFLPSYPVVLPTAGNDLELDVLTCHHSDYYGSQTKEAPDTEEPVPVIFPTVAPGIVFVFAVHSSEMNLARAARVWLRAGLSIFGLGGKTSSGYGWFDFNLQSGPSEEKPVSPSTITTSEHPLIAEWKGRTGQENFRAFRPKLAAMQDTEELRHIFHTIMPAAHLSNLTRRNSYWQSFTSHPDGAAIFQRLNLSLR